MATESGHGHAKSSAKEVYSQFISGGTTRARNWIASNLDGDDKLLKDTAGWLDYFGRGQDATGTSDGEKRAKDYHKLGDVVREYIGDDDVAVEAHEEAAAVADVEEQEAQSRGKARKLGHRKTMLMGAKKGQRQRAGRAAFQGVRIIPAGGGRGASRSDDGGAAPLHLLGQQRQPGAGLRPAGGGIRALLAQLQASNEPEQDQGDEMAALVELLSAIGERQPSDELDLSSILSLNVDEPEPDMNSALLMALLAQLGEGELEEEAPSAGTSLAGVGGSSSSGSPLDPLSALVPGRMSIPMAISTLAIGASTFSQTVTCNTQMGGPYFLSIHDPSNKGAAITSLQVNGSPVYIGPASAVAFISNHRISTNDARGLPFYVGSDTKRNWNEYITKCGCTGAWDAPIQSGSTVTLTGTLVETLTVPASFGFQIACSPYGAAQGMSYGNGAQVKRANITSAIRMLGGGGGGKKLDLSSLLGGRRGGTRALQQLATALNR